MTLDTDVRKAIGEENHALLLESLRDVFRTGYGEIHISISQGRVRTIRTEVSRMAKTLREESE